MGRKADPVALIWDEGPAAFAFLVEDWDFLGPERHPEGLSYHRGDLHIEISHWQWKHEAGFSTRIWSPADPSHPPARRVHAELEDLLVACSLGVPQDVPGQSGGMHTIRKRIQQH